MRPKRAFTLKIPFRPFLIPLIVSSSIKYQYFLTLLPNAQYSRLLVILPLIKLIEPPSFSCCFNSSAFASTSARFLLVPCVAGIGLSKDFNLPKWSVKSTKFFAASISASVRGRRGLAASGGRPDRNASKPP